MTKVIRAIFENGIFRPVEKVDLQQHQEVKIIVPEDVPTEIIATAAKEMGSFDFLFEPQEDIYTISDGEPV